MVTLMVVAVTLAVAVPNFQSAIQSNQLASNTNQFVSALSLARSEAIKRGMCVTVRKTSANWENGWQIFMDALNGAGKCGTKEVSDEVLRVYDALPENYTLRGNNNVKNYISFLPSGESNINGSFALCYDDRKSASRLIIVGPTGRVRLGLDSDHDGIPEKADGAELTSCTSP